MTSLKKVKLGDIAEITTGFPFKGSGYSNLGIRVLRGENVSLGQLRWDTVKCWNHPFSDVEKYSLNEDDIVIGMDGSRVGRNKAQIKKNDLPLLLAQRVARVKTRFGYSQTLIAYIIKSPLFEKYVEKVQTGTSIPHISQTQIEDFKFDIISDYKTQCSIAEILSSLDDKIELNNKINQELESLAQLLFKRWFVDFEFPNENGEPYKSSGGEMVDSELGEIPKEWKVNFLTKELKVVYGKNLPTTLLEPNGYNVYGGNGIIGKYKTYLYEQQQVLIACRGAASGKVNISNKQSFVTNNSLVLEYSVGTKINFSYLKYWSFNQNFTNCVSGSAQPQITIENLSSNLILVPIEQILNKFEFIVNPILTILSKNILENENLTEIRNLLLPKLITGELQITDK